MNVPKRDRYLTTGEVAKLLRVNPRTVQRWAAAGRVDSVQTSKNGHRRFRESEIRRVFPEVYRNRNEE